MHHALALILAVLPAADSNHVAGTAREKLVIADYFAHHTSRPHDGRLGPWQQDVVAKQSSADKVRFVYNADLVDENGRHQLAAPAYPKLGMQSDLDPDYQEFQILLAKVAHIDGFVLEWAMSSLSSPSIRGQADRTAPRLGMREEYLGQTPR